LKFSLFSLIVPLVLLISKTETLKAQKKYTKEIGLISENDLYTSLYYDRYYTNGTFIYFRFLDKNSHRNKKIHELSINHKMYTPNFANSFSIEDIDRPYAGYIFAKYSQQIFSKNNFSLKSSFEIGILGPDAIAQDLQNLIHKIYGFRPAEGWQYQIRNTLGLGVGFTLLKPFNKTPKKHIDFTSSSELKLGTILSELNIAVYTRMNLFNSYLNPYSNSTLFSSNLNPVTKTQKKELFLFLKPQIGLAFYNATIQGSLFNQNSPVVFGINSFIYEIEFGIKYALNRFDLSYSIIKYSKRTHTIKANNSNYGSIIIGYKFN